MTHGPERRRLTAWALLTPQFYFAPLVTSWTGISAARLAEVACVAYLWHGMEMGHKLNGWHVALWGLCFVAIYARDSKDLRLGFGTVLGRRADDREIREAAVETAEKADAVVEKIDAKTEHAPE